MRYSAKCVIFIVLLIAVSLAIAAVLTFYTQHDSVIPHRKDVIRWIEEEQIVKPVDVEEVHALLFKESIYEALREVRNLRFGSYGHANTDADGSIVELNKDGIYNSYCAVVRSKIHMMYTDYDGITNIVLERMRVDNQQLHRFATKQMYNAIYGETNVVEVMDGIYLLKSEWENYSELTNFFQDVINEELDGITTGRTRVRIPKRKFSDDTLNQMIWGNDVK